MCDKLGAVYSEMIFKHGYVHCDPHPGNVLVHQTKDRSLELVLLDHGLYTVVEEYYVYNDFCTFYFAQSMSEQFRVDYAHLWLSIIKADLDGNTVRC